MRRPLRLSRKKNSARPKLCVPRRLGSEFLEDRRLMACDSFGLSGEYAALAQSFATKPDATGLFLNFDGRQTPSDMVAPFTSGNTQRDIQDILFRTSEVFAPFNVGVMRHQGVNNFVPGGNASTVFVGNFLTNSTSAGYTPSQFVDKPGDTLGLSHVPNSNWYDIAYANSGNQTLNNLVRTIAHEAGHTFGLTHVRTDGLTDPLPVNMPGFSTTPDVMSYDSLNSRFTNQSFTTTSWNNTASGLQLQSGIKPKYAPILSLASPCVFSTQNSYAYMDAVIGSRPVDDVANVAHGNSVDAAYSDSPSKVLSANGDATLAKIDRLGDYDVFDVNSDGDPFSIWVTPKAGGSLDLVVMVYDSTGALVAYNNDIGGTSSSGIQLDPVGSASFKVVVGALDGNSQGDYSFLVFEKLNLGSIYSASGDSGKGSDANASRRMDSRAQSEWESDDKAAAQRMDRDTATRKETAKTEGTSARTSGQLAQDKLRETDALSQFFKSEFTEFGDPAEMLKLLDQVPVISVGYPAPDDDGPVGPIGPVVHSDQWNTLTTLGAESALASSSEGAWCGSDVERLAEWLKDWFEPEPDPGKSVISADGLSQPALAEHHDLAIGEIAPASSPSSLATIAGQTGYPADDDSGPWGPIGPVISEFLGRLSHCEPSDRVLAAEAVGSSLQLASDVGYPAPDDNGPLGPIGPVVHQKTTAHPVTPPSGYDQALELLAAAASGDLGYPAPDDDGPWGPIGPVIQEVALQLSTLLTEAARQGAALPSDPWGGFGDAEPAPDWRQPIVTEAGSLAEVGAVTSRSGMATGVGQVGYPADDDIGPWGPIGPVVHQVHDGAIADVAEVSATGVTQEHANKGISAGQHARG